MTTSIAQRINAAPLSTADKRELLAVFSSIQADLQAMATDTTATAITLNTTA